jgi:ribosomal protein S18 acetylase RimI-like enzyme
MTTLRHYDQTDDFDEVFSFAREIISEPPHENAQQELSDYPLKKTVAKVALNDAGEIIGFCTASFPYWNGVAIMDYLVVKPEWRNNGVGAELVTEVEQELRHAGIRIVTVQTVAWNEAGIRFYERQEYTRRVVFRDYFGESNHMVWLDRSLPTQTEESR